MAFATKQFTMQPFRLFPLFALRPLAYETQLDNITVLNFLNLTPLLHPDPMNFPCPRIITNILSIVQSLLPLSGLLLLCNSWDCLHTAIMPITNMFALSPFSFSNVGLCSQGKSDISFICLPSYLHTRSFATCPGLRMQYRERMLDYTIATPAPCAPTLRQRLHRTYPGKHPARHCLAIP